MCIVSECFKVNNSIICWGFSGSISLKTLTSYFAVQWMSNDLHVRSWLIEEPFFNFCIFAHEFLVSWVCVPWVLRDEYGRCTALLAMRWVMVKAHRCDVLLWQYEPGVYWDIRMCQGERDALVSWGLDLSFSLKYITKSRRQHDSTGNTCGYIQTTDTTFLPHRHLARRVENSWDEMLQCFGCKVLGRTASVSHDAFVMFDRLQNNTLVNKMDWNPTGILLTFTFTLVTHFS